MGDLAARADRLLDELTTMVSAAGAAILTARAAGLDPQRKPDSSPVTAADKAAEAVILGGLARLMPDIPVVSEESCGDTPAGELDGNFILVDPLDGTRELLAGRDEFTVNVAIVSGGQPIAGIVAAPALSLVWRGTATRGAERLRLAPGASVAAARDRAAIRTRAAPATGLIAAVSRSHLDAGTEAFLAKLPVGQRISCGSAVKFCQLAEGSADIYPRFSPTYEWDVAAGHAVLAAAGGAVAAPDGTLLSYGRTERRLLIPSFIACGDPKALPGWRTAMPLKG